MSDITWTAEQKKVIEARDCNILVSAAAGSGKTAVLVERIVQRIMDRREPVDIDCFLVVTFTKAAAAQMKERLRKRLEKELKNQPDNEHLQRQIGLISSAHISTIHSFCNFVIENYFHRIGLDPSFRQATQTEGEMLFSETFAQILEEEYEAGREDFIELAEMSELNRSDDELERMVKKIYEYAMAQPFPQEFFNQMERFLEVETVEEWEQSQLVQKALAGARIRVEEIAGEQELVRRLCHESGGPAYYEPHIIEIGDYCQTLLAAETYDEWRRILAAMTFLSMRKKKDDTVDEDIRKEVVERRNECKKRLQNLYKKYFAFAREESLHDLHEMRGKVRTLLRLTRRMHEAFIQEKRERNVVDFNDLEQLALSILLRWDEEKEEYVRTEAACELAEHFVEIMIDEYQDSNRVQDTLLRSVSREGLPEYSPNIFMVGDVKQSIYRFRGGCPELFADKLEAYSLADGASCRRIDLHQNFRSRGVVLEAANEVFQLVMHRDIGGVEYDERAALRAGRKMTDTELPVAKTVDVHALLGKQNIEAEGYVIAEKIKEMTDGENRLFIDKGGDYRPVEYRDIVILILAHAQGQELFDALTESGIPVVMERRQGFYDTKEITLMVSMLRIIDNPHQDIALATVLLSPAFSLMEEDLAQIRVESRDTDLYDALCSYEKADERYNKIRQFLDVLEKLRSKVTYAAVAELVQDIYDSTGIYEAVAMMKDGVQRTANMDKLMEQARQFERTTYHGLYQFVRYLEQITQQTEEAGEVNLVGEEENVVRIMTIHKSKGLEFPVCFVAGMGRRLNLPHKDFLSIAPNIGIAAPVVDNKRRTKKKNFYTTYINDCNKSENIGEWIRKLYVAMTRAEEKLILVGCTLSTEAKTPDVDGRSRINTMFDMVLPAVHAHCFRLYEWEQEALLDTIQRELVQEAFENETVYNFDTTRCYNKTIRDYLIWLAAREEDSGETLPVKVSVSDLKMMSMQDDGVRDVALADYAEEEEEMPIPSFMRQEETDDKEKQGAAYGTIWHQVMATIDFKKAVSEEAVEDEIARLCETGRLREQDVSVLNIRRLNRFFRSPLGEEMRQAEAEGRLHREQPFVMGRKASEIFSGCKKDDTVLVQGIIDGYYETGNGIVLIDYKTDALREGEEVRLLERYGKQMALYRQALEEMTGKPVIRCVLYSFSLGKEVLVSQKNRMEGYYDV